MNNTYSEIHQLCPVTVFTPFLRGSNRANSILYQRLNRFCKGTTLSSFQIGILGYTDYKIQELMPYQTTILCEQEITILYSLVTTDEENINIHLSYEISFKNMSMINKFLYIFGCHTGEIYIRGLTSIMVVQLYNLWI